MIKMEERFKEIQKGKYPPLIIFPEGGTTNGRYLVKFKKGAFVGNYPVQPILFKYHSRVVDLEQCVMPIYMHIILTGISFGAVVDVYELPVFTPNEFFFSKYQKEGEE
jgi:lysophosphatidylcholine acyltransferase/lyso-PAF acetyltransferase